MSFINKSIIWKLIIPVVLSFVYIMVGFAIYLPSRLEHNTIEETIDFAQQSAEQAGKLRTYYTKHIFAAVQDKQHNIKFATTYQDKSGVLPIPATFLHDVTQTLSNDAVNYAFSGPLPFNHRKGRHSDDFSQNAWRFLNENPSKSYYQVIQDNGRKWLRVGIADRLNQQTCVDCHNRHIDSPKKDWRLGDVRAVLEMTVDITDKELANTELINMVFIAIGGLLIVVVSVLSVSYSSLIKKKVQLIIDLINKAIAGDLSVQFDDGSRDELAKIMTSINRLIDQYKNVNVFICEAGVSVAKNHLSLHNLNEHALAQIAQHSKLIAKAKSDLLRRQTRFTGDRASHLSQSSVEPTVALSEVNQLLAQLHHILQLLEQDVTEAAVILRQLSQLSEQINTLLSQK